MSEPSRQFTLDIDVPATGTALVNCLGPVVEDWNRRYDRNASVSLTNKYSQGKLVARDESYKHGTNWQLAFSMRGPQTSDDKVAELSALVMATIWEKMGLTQPSGLDPFHP